MRPLFQILIGLFALTLTGCNVDIGDISAKVLGSEIVAELENYNDAAISKNKESLFAKAHPQIKDEITEDLTQQIFDSIKGHKILKQELLGANKSFSAGIKDSKTVSYTAIYEVQTEEAFHLFRYSLVDSGEGPLLTYFHVNQNDTSFKDANAFGSVKKSPLRILFLIAMAVIFSFILFSVYGCIRTKGLKRKWLWIIFILCGIHGLNLNWTTGEISQTFFLYDAATQNFSFSLIQFNFLGVSASKDSALSPWILSAFFPLGAVIFWLKHRDNFVKSFQKPLSSASRTD
jgi:hypothetical protein